MLCISTNSSFVDITYYVVYFNKLIDGPDIRFYYVRLVLIETSISKYFPFVNNTLI